MIKLCPVCDSEISGRFCKTCGKFVTPVEYKGDIHLNSDHDDGDDSDCDYHGTTAFNDVLYHGTDADKCEPTVNGYSYSMGAAEPKPPIKYGLVLGVLAVVGLISFAIIAYFSKAEEAGKQEQKPISTDIVSTNDDPLWADRPLSDEELAEKRLANGFDEDGYKYYTKKEVMDGKLESNWTSHYNESHVTTIRHISDALSKDGELYYVPYGEIDSDNLYSFMDNWGNVTYYFSGYDDIYFFESEEKDSEYLGYASAIYDLYTNKTDLVEVGIYKDKDLLCKITTLAILGINNSDGDYDDIYSLVESNFYSGFQYEDLWIYTFESEDEDDESTYFANIYVY